MGIVVAGVQTPLQTLPFEFQELVEQPRELQAGAFAGLVPTTTVYEVERGDHNVVVFAVQKALNATALKPENRVKVDWSYGASTFDAVKRFQDKKNLYVDGKFGPRSSLAMAGVLDGRASSAVIPPRMLEGLIEGESGGYIGASNASVAGGIDVSYCQRRIYDENYNSYSVVQAAYDPLYQVNLFASRLRNRKDAFLARSAVDTHEWAWRLACLYHNYPYAADKIASVGIGGLSSYFTTAQSWVLAIGAEMTDGTPVRTPLGWCKYYALGAPEYQHKGKMVRYVTNWVA